MYRGIEVVEIDYQSNEGKALLDIIGVFNEIIEWADISNHGQNGIALPVSRLSRDMIAPVISEVVQTNCELTRNFGHILNEEATNRLLISALAMDQLGVSMLTPYYVSNLTPEVRDRMRIKREAPRGGTDGPVVANDVGQFGADRQGD